MKKIIGFSAAALVLLVPGIVLAQAPLGNVESIFNSVYTIAQLLVKILMVVAVLVFFWGLIKFILSAGDEEGRKSGIQIMIWGVVALAVMVSIWGLVYFLQQAFGITDSAEAIKAPTNIGGLIPT